MLIVIDVAGCDINQASNPVIHLNLNRPLSGFLINVDLYFCLIMDSKSINDILFLMLFNVDQCLISGDLPLLTLKRLPRIFFMTAEYSRTENALDFLRLLPKIIPCPKADR